MGYPRTVIVRASGTRAETSAADVLLLWLVDGFLR